MVFETYRAILNNYSHEKIGVLGLSWGGTAAMTMISWNNYYQENLPMPALSIALSLATYRQVLLKRKDSKPIGVGSLYPSRVDRSLWVYTERRRRSDSWLMHTAHGDFRNAGKIFTLFAEHESLAFAPHLPRVP